MKSRLSQSVRNRSGAERMRPDSLEAQFEAVRQQSERLTLPLSAEDCALQSMPDASPVKWHLAHTTWFFETFILEPSQPGYHAFHPQFRVLFNSYYVAVGARHPRPERGLLSRPPFDEVLAYRRHVDRHMAELLAAASLSPSLRGLVELGIHHEQQHQELILTDVKHLLSRNPLKPAYCDPPPVAATRVEPLAWIVQPDGIRQIGHGGGGFCFDNEEPRHRVFLDAFEIATRPVTNGEYLEFIADGGYDKPALWLAEGWDVRTAQCWSAPLYWERDGDNWRTFTLHGMQPLAQNEPVCHVSFFEADAYARWAGARLPTEAEWETFAAGIPLEGNFVEGGRVHPATCTPGDEAHAAQVYGDVWEWTRSAYEPYPGYRVAAGAVGEYNGKFMANQYVLRGGSCATPSSHIRASYRNFFPAAARWQFSGIRLARDGA